MESLKSAKLRYIMMHPIRHEIVKLIKKQGKSYASQLAKELNLDRKLVSYHLLTLMQHKIIVGDYAVRGGPPTDEEGRPIIVKYYELTEEAKKILSE